MCDVIESFLEFVPFVVMPCAHIDICDMTHSYLCCDSFICVTRAIRECKVIHSYVSCVSDVIEFFLEFVLFVGMPCASGEIFGVTNLHV